MGTLESTIDAIDLLVGSACLDPEIEAPLTRCRAELAALSWERFRVRHEALSQQATAANARAAFVQRHKTHI